MLNCTLLWLLGQSKHAPLFNASSLVWTILQQLLSSESGVQSTASQTLMHTLGDRNLAALSLRLIKGLFNLKIIFSFSLQMILGF